MTDKIYLYNRYYKNGQNYLEKIQDNKYSLHVKNPDFCRFIYKEGQSTDANDYYAVDPDGGPFMSLEYKINDDEKINKIYIENEQTIIETKNINADE